MKIYFPLAKIDAERHEVWGYASTEARDDQGEVVKRDALISALGDYMKFANIREMHQLSAVGVAKEAAVDEKGLYVGAKIVDPIAWQKVVEGVYKGYSIGGQVTQRDPVDYKTITGLVLNEISLVDRPANPEAVFDYWKSAGASRMLEARLDQPFQIWACGVPEHRHLAKSDAVRCQERMSGEDLVAITTASNATAERASINTGNEVRPAADNGEYADPGYQSDSQKRYPIDTEQHIRAAWNFINRTSNALRYTRSQLDKIKNRIIAAWKQKIDKDGPPSLDQEKKANLPLTKALEDVGHVARIILDLMWLQESLAAEAKIGEDNSPDPSRLQTIISELCDLLNSLVTEETAEILDGADLTGEPPIGIAADVLIMAAGAQGASLVAELCEGRNQKLQQLAAAISIKARHSDGDQALIGIAHHAVSQSLRMRGLRSGEKGHMAMAREALDAAGAFTGEEVGVDATRTSKVQPAISGEGSSTILSNENAAFSNAVDALSSTRVIDMIAATLRKGAPGHLALLDLAHESVSKLTNGVCCRAAKVGEAYSVGDAYSKETSDHLRRAHHHLIAAGAQCDGVICDSEVDAEETEFQPAKAASGNLAKMFAGERAEKAALVAMLAEIVPRLDQLTKRVEDIARTPLPPVTIAKTAAAVATRQDVGGSAFSTDELAAAFSQMSKEEQTLTLIKASYARPINPPGVTRAKDSCRVSPA